MAIMRILTEGAPVLRRKCKPVEKIDERIRQLLDDMLATMYAAPGVGLAAPQVGISKRLVVIDVGDEGPGPIKLVNPKWKPLNDEEELGAEGCLSCPGIQGDVWRSTAVSVKALNEFGEHIEFEAKGFFARCVQHELDHLDGILYIDKAEEVRSNQAGEGEETEESEEAEPEKSDVPGDTSGVTDVEAGV